MTATVGVSSARNSGRKVGIGKQVEDSKLLNTCKPPLLKLLRQGSVTPSFDWGSLNIPRPLQNGMRSLTRRDSPISNLWRTSWGDGSHTRR